MRLISEFILTGSKILTQNLAIRISKKHSDESLSGDQLSSGCITSKQFRLC